MLSQAQRFKITMLDQKHKLDQETFQIPGPPLRAPAPAVAMPAAAPAAAMPAAATSAPSTPTPAASRTMSSEEITSSLGRLADLRDRGAITPEEYEAKKADLLGRL
jgi:hypothetical protein